MQIIIFCSYFSQGAIILGSKPNLKLAKKYKKVFPPTMMIIEYIKQHLFHSDLLSQLHGLFIGNTPAVAITDFSLAKELFSRRAPSQVQLLTILHFCLIRFQQEICPSLCHWVPPSPINIMITIPNFTNKSIILSFREEWCGRHNTIVSRWFCIKILIQIQNAFRHLYWSIDLFILKSNSLGKFWFWQCFKGCAGLRWQIQRWIDDPVWYLLLFDLKVLSLWQWEEQGMEVSNKQN